MATPQEIFEITKHQNDLGLSMLGKVRDAALSNSFDVSSGERLIGELAKYMAATDKIFDLIENNSDDMSLEQEDALSDMASVCHDLGNETLLLVMEKVKSLGGNANLMLSNAQKRHYD